MQSMSSFRCSGSFFWWWFWLEKWWETGRKRQRVKESRSKLQLWGTCMLLEYKRQRVRHRLTKTKKTNECRWKKGNARESYISLQWTPYQFKVFCIMSLRHLKTWKIAFVRHFSISFFLSSCLSIFFAPISFPISLFNSFCSLFVKWCLKKLYTDYRKNK